MRFIFKSWFYNISPVCLDLRSFLPFFILMIHIGFFIFCYRWQFADIGNKARVLLVHLAVLNMLEQAARVGKPEMFFPEMRQDQMKIL